MDYFNGLTYVTEGHGAGMVGTVGLAYFTWWFLYLISFKNAYLSFAVYTGSVILYVLFYNLKNLLSGPLPKMPLAKLVRSLFILSFLTYPVLFTLDRGNIEGLAFICLSLFIYFFCSGKTWIGSFFLAAAATLKLYPIIFFLLYITEKKYKEAAILVGAVLVLYALSYNSAQGITFGLWSFVSMIKGSADPNNIYNILYVIGDEGAAFSSSAYGALKATIYEWDPQYSGPRLLGLFSNYYWVSFLFFVLVSLYVVIVEKEFWKKVAILTLSMVFFPFVAADYRLLNLYVPMWLFLNSAKQSRTDFLYSILFALLLIPKAYYPIKGDISISVILNPLIIFVFLLSIIAMGLRNICVKDIKLNMGEHVTAARNILRLRKVFPGSSEGAQDAKRSF